MSEPRILTWAQIEGALESVDAVQEMEQAFVAYSAGRCVIPPVGELNFSEPKGDVHIKYGYVTGDDFYVVKIASGFYDNPKLGLSSSNGLMLLFRQATGELVAVLLDEGRLTDIRTAAAGAVAATHLAPAEVECIGILGTGIQARLQLLHLRGVVDCDRVMVWGRTPDNTRAYADEMAARGFDIATAKDPAEVAAACNLIVTTTPSESPLLQRADIRPGTHITAVGADTASKQELDAAILRDCTHLVADSKSQCQERGEISHGLRAGNVALAEVLELGSIIASSAPPGRADDEISVADLTGVAVQDVQIASAVFRSLS